MSVLNTLPAPVVQMGLVEKIVDQQQNQPHALLQAEQEASREQLKAEAQRIGKSELVEQGRRVRDRGEKQREKQPGPEHRGGNRPGQPPAESFAGQESALPEETPPANPWAGNIVNLKI